MDSSVSFSRNHQFEDCKDDRCLRFDFVIFKDGKPMHVIEFDGIQHFQPVEHFGGEGTFALRKRHDQLKNRYCKAHQIQMTRLPYTMSFEQIKESIQNIINP